MHMEVLLVEDNLALAETVMAYFELEGIHCDYAASGPQGLNLALSRRYQTILLDINLPRMDGLQVCEALRNQGITTPVLMLTARDTLQDKLAGFDAGTDDYLIKPFELSELVARVKALAQRRSVQVQKLRVGPLTLDLAQKVVSRDGQVLNLTPTGWTILELLMRESPDVVSREKIEQAIWGLEDLPDSNSLKVHLYRLRQQVDKPFAAQMLHTIANHGIALRTPDE
ncbi:MAG: response regulator transcription factor [Pseudomonadota bacterium]